MTRGGLLAMLGGDWHDFDAFAAWMRSLAVQSGLVPHMSFDAEDLTRLSMDAPQVVLMNSCFDETSEVGYSDDQVGSLGAWVEGGGRLLAVHGATVAARRNSNLRRLLGGAFVDHPPFGPLEVSCVGSQHPMVAGILPFFIDDELYRHVLEPSVEVHLVASNGREVEPVAWSQHVLRGKVAYVALGHDERAWEHPAFGRIMKQSLDWLLEPP